MKRFKTTFNLAAVAASALALTGLSANAATVWNVNIGNQIDETDNYVGAAFENTANSTWNSVTTGTTPATPFATTLADSTGDNSAGVTLGISATVDVTYITWAGLPAGDEIFEYAFKSSDNSTPYSVALGGLSPTATYDLVIYSDWSWKANNNLPVTQTAGAGMTETIYVNRDNFIASGVGPLLQDTDPTNTTVGTGTNFYRISGLTPDGSGDLGFDMGGTDSPLNGFQLVDTIPEPSSAALLGLGGLALLRRRRK